MWPLARPLNYRTGSGPGSPSGQPAWGGGSDLVVSETLNYAPPQRMLDFDEKTNSLSNAIRPGRYHHPSRAARLGTPVRFRFCIECGLACDQIITFLSLYRVLTQAQAPPAGQPRWGSRSACPWLPSFAPSALLKEEACNEKRFSFCPCALLRFKCWTRRLSANASEWSGDCLFPPDCS
jgi:hypothetical protein